MKRSTFLFSIAIIVLMIAGRGLALDKGAILYHTSEDGKMYGLTALELPCSLVDILILREVGSGHVALYIGNERIIHAVSGGVEETDSRNFIPESDLDRGFRYVGAKVPLDYDDLNIWSDTRKSQLILFAKQQIGKSYDIDFSHQKGEDGDFTCVGLVEYVYENFEGGAGYDITTYGYYPGDGTGRSENQTYNCAETLWQDDTRENSFANDVEFSRIQHPSANTLDVGREHNGDRYIFFPHTQYIQATTTSVTTDVPVSGGSGSDDDDDWWECFIVTAAYGSPLHPHVTTFRSFRDRYLRTFPAGRMIIGAYYKYSQPFARFIAKHPWARTTARIILLPALVATFLTLQIGSVLTLLAIAVIVGLLCIPMYHYRRKRLA